MAFPDVRHAAPSGPSASVRPLSVVDPKRASTNFRSKWVADVEKRSGSSAQDLFPGHDHFRFYVFPQFIVFVEFVLFTFG